MAAVTGHRQAHDSHRAESDWAGSAHDLLDAMPDATALVDGDGIISDVNHAWVMFALDNGGLAADTGVGVDYLAVCERAAARGCDDARFAADGLRAVLRGETVERDFDYACPSPSAGRWYKLRITPVRGEHPAALVSHVNITRHKITEFDLELRASHDPLTGLANRSMLQSRLAKALTTRPGRKGRADVGVVCLDLNRFKPVNDDFGHAAGDEVLLEVAARLRSAVRPQDTVARSGGDEFVVVAPRVDSDAMVALGERISVALAEPHLVHGCPVTVGASVGTHLASPGEDVGAALEAADAAMYVAKRRSQSRE